MFAVPPDVTSVGGPLAAGEYFARVRGLNGAGPGPASNEARFRVGDVPACDAPQPPVLLPATVDRPHRHARRGARRATWRSATIACSSARRRRQRSRDARRRARDLVRRARAAGACITSPLLATNACGTSTPSNPIEVIVSARRARPRPPTCAATVSGSQVTLAWDAVAAPRRTCSRPGSRPASATSRRSRSPRHGLAVTGVPSGTYYVRVRAVGVGGATSVPSAEIVIVVP